MKKFILLSSVLMSSLFLLAGCGIVDTISCIGKDSVKVFNWGEYMDPAIIKNFEKEHDVCVKLVTFDSNESAITKMKTESFDVIMPSDYAIEQMVGEDLLEVIDWSRIDNLDKTTGLADGLSSILESVPFNLLNYGVPYFWGNVGIVYNKDEVTLAELQEKQWNIFKESYDIAFYDSARDGFMVALKQLGYSMNTSNTAELTKAENWLKEIAGKSNVTFLTDEILDDMPELKYDLALAYSGDAIYLMSEQDKLGFFVPTVGTNVWVDAMVIPKNAKNKDLAYDFINFVSSYDQALLNTEYVYYSTPRKDVYEDVILEDGEFYDYIDAYEVIINEHDEVFAYLPEVKNFTSDAWARIRIS